MKSFFLFSLVQSLVFASPYKIIQFFKRLTLKLSYQFFPLFFFKVFISVCNLQNSPNNFNGREPNGQLLGNKKLTFSAMSTSSVQVLVLFLDENQKILIIKKNFLHQHLVEITYCVSKAKIKFFEQAKNCQLECKQNDFVIDVVII